VALYTEDEVAGQGAFLDQFDDERTPPGSPVVGAVYPKTAGVLVTRADAAGWGARIRWTAVGIIWLLALLLVAFLVARAV
jgi:hypothetical protein